MTKDFITGRRNNPILVWDTFGRPVLAICFSVDIDTLLQSFSLLIENEFRILFIFNWMDFIAKLTSKHSAYFNISQLLCHEWKNYVG